MELKPGYKQTEAGIIPDDWKTKPLLDAVTIATGQVSPKLEPYKEMVLVAPDHIESRTGTLLDLETAGIQGAISGKYLFHPGDVVYSKIRPYLRKAFLADFDGLCSADMYPLTPKPDMCAGFVLALLLSERFSRFAESVSVRSGIPKINREELAEFVIPFPSLREQRAIVAALSDTDALLSSLDRLLAKKRDIKQAVMQQLLTGKQRLPGFSEEWKYEKLGRLFQFLNTGNNPRSDLSSFGDVGYVHYGDIHTERVAFLNCATAELPLIAHNKVSKLPRLQDGDLIMADASEDYVGIGKSVEIKNIGSRKIVAGLHTFLLRGDKELITDGYKGYLQFLPSVKYAMTRYAVGISIVSSSFCKSWEHPRVSTVL